MPEDFPDRQATPLRHSAVTDRPKPRPRVLFFWIMIVALGMAGVLAAMAFLALVLIPSIIQSAVKSGADAPITVELATATEQDIPTSVTGIGSVQAVHQVTVAPEVAGKIVGLQFESGAEVRKAPLVQLNDAPERGDLLNYQAQARLAELNLQRSKQLVGQEFTSRQSVDQNAATLAQAEAGIAHNQALIDQKLIRAPFSGVLGVRQVDLGQRIDAGGAIVTLTDLDTVYVNFTLSERERPKLEIGQTVDVAVDAYTERTFTGRLTSIEPQISADSRNIKLQATFKNADHALLPGMFANATLRLPTRRGILVPETAVEFNLYGNSVLIAEPDGAGLRAKRVMVKSGERLGGNAVILDGVKSGDRVVRSGQLRVTDGGRITAVETNLLQPAARLPDH